MDTINELAMNVGEINQKQDQIISLCNEMRDTLKSHDARLASLEGTRNKVNSIWHVLSFIGGWIVSFVPHIFR